MVGVFTLLLGGLFWWVGGLINTTKSIPVGLYWKSDKPIEKGAYVLFCPPKTAVFDEAKARGYIGAGLCLGGYGYLMKKILAVKNDVVSVSDSGVRVNGDWLPLSIPRRVDRAGREMPRYHIQEYSLKDSELLLMSDVSSTSFDSRYYGFIQRSQIQSVIRPIITW